jgi:phosphatidylglycerophosphatase A
MTSSNLRPDRTPPARTPAAWWLATCFGLGWMKPGPGTWASVAAFLLWLPLAFYVSSAVAFAITLLLAVLSTLVGIPVASRVADEANIGDPGFVVIDEAAGTWTALLAACAPFAFGVQNGNPVSWKAGIAALVLFRVFDIWKPWPVSALDRMHGGVGIMLDDIAAGLYAAVCVLLLRHFSLLP